MKILSEWRYHLQSFIVLHVLLRCPDHRVLIFLKSHCRPFECQLFASGGEASLILPVDQKSSSVREDLPLNSLYLGYEQTVVAT